LGGGSYNFPKKEGITERGIGKRGEKRGDRSGKDTGEIGQRRARSSTACNKGVTRSDHRSLTKQPERRMDNRVKKKDGRIQIKKGPIGNRRFGRPRKTPATRKKTEAKQPVCKGLE